MEKTYTLWERISSATPKFFKRAQAFGLGLVGLGTSLTQVAGIPARLTTIMISAGTTITIVAQFAVKQYQPLNTKQDENIK
ncbi:hypothetical protein ABIB62_004059 [Mucilaginibacter sp. UYP25]|uniref:hypothetical protein n=1 Tax=unclassified Mucilaginibacter TaxID=2617802 RepID=UPI003397B374